MTGLTGKILITGGTGSLGKATLLLAEQEEWNAEFVIFSRDETKQGKLRRRFPQHTYLLGDVAKYPDIASAVRGTKPDIILHYAAYKQVPAAQNNVHATVETNVLGSQNVVNAALEYGVKQVVASSTDKAAESVNAYGSSKHLMECLFQNGNKWGITSFHLARYGNVVASNSSVIPFFKEQLTAGGPLTVTDFRMVRFWISLREAVELILRALEQKPGVIVVPKAPSMYIKKLAECMIQNTLGCKDIKVKELKIRPGEKLVECMVTKAESFHTLQDADYFYIYPPTSDMFNAKAPFTYTSDNPMNWLTWPGMLQLIAESNELGS